jgi:hypothetical protein
VNSVLVFRNIPQSSHDFCTSVLKQQCICRNSVSSTNNYTKKAFLIRKKVRIVLRAGVAYMLVCWILTLCRITFSFRLRLIPGPNSVTLKAEAARSFEASEQTRYTHGVKPQNTVI